MFSGHKLAGRWRRRRPIKKRARRKKETRIDSFAGRFLLKTSAPTDKLVVACQSRQAAAYLCKEFLIIAGAVAHN